MSDVSQDREGATAGAGVTTVVLPCPPDKFTEFIAGLLGRPQTIEAGVDGPFVVQRDDVSNLYHLIDQRIASQNEASLVQFTARIVFDNNSSVLLNSLEDYLAYNEVKPLRSIALHLSWTYLIKFRLKAFPEKQVIQISLNSDERQEVVFGRAVVARLSIADDTFIAPMRIRIEHTDRTWGTDMEALITGHLRLLQTQIGKCRRLANRYSGWIGFVSSSVALIISAVLVYKIQQYFALQMSAALPMPKGPVSLDSMAQQLSFVANVIVRGQWSRFGILLSVFLIVTAVGAIALGATVADAAYQPPRSFVLLTTKAVAARNEYLRKIENSWWHLAGWITATVALGVLSNGVFYLGLKYFGGMP